MSAMDRKQTLVGLRFQCVRGFVEVLGHTPKHGQVLIG